MPDTVSMLLFIFMILQENMSSEVCNQRLLQSSFSCLWKALYIYCTQVLYMPYADSSENLPSRTDEHADLSLCLPFEPRHAKIRMLTVRYLKCTCPAIHWTRISSCLFAVSSEPSCWVCEQRRFRQDCAFAQACLNLCCLHIHYVNHPFCVLWLKCIRRGYTEEPHYNDRILPLKWICRCKESQHVPVW